ncbi:MAG TPA: dihydrolipoamide acetyltransferase family protein [Candidatus Acidoferrum sp.]|jgi:pyruvate dehydrogenase E2 component (dihydrolipoamide acetyltransferase)|nr:dihydrolipoamide acetyltransferase family protein [Candidatus Acidoferrum sp.]
MAISVVMPALEMAQETGKLLAWRKKEGEAVKKGEPLLEIETDKAVVEIEAPGDGFLAGITAHEGAVIPVGETIAWLVKAGEKAPALKAVAAPSARATSVAPAAERAAAAARGAATAAAPTQTPTQISPKARRLAKELGVEISGLRGTGPDGTITAEDVQTAADGKKSARASSMAAPASSPASSFAAPGSEALSQIARLMAERMTQSWTTVPHFFLTRDVDCTELMATHKKLGPAVEKSNGARLTITDLLIAVVAHAITKHPVMNASWAGSGIRQNSEINISLAMAVKDGVVGAVIRKADSAKISDIAAQRRDLTERARSNRLRPADISGGTFTISNLGMYQVDAFIAIITPPQAATLAVGMIADRVVAAKGKPAIRPMMTVTLSSDHRVLDGARAAEFLNTLTEAIQKPDGWVGE